jgi:long-chain acyl-CoA synthetase
LYKLSRSGGIGAAPPAANSHSCSPMAVSLSAHLDAVNAQLDPHEQLDCLVVVSEPWTVDNGFITPTFKVKRNRIEEAYAPLYERWTGTHQRVVWHHG